MVLPMAFCYVLFSFLFVLQNFDLRLCLIGILIASLIHLTVPLSSIQGLDGEATEPMIKEIDEDREETQDPEVEFAIAGAVRECGGLEILLGMVQVKVLIQTLAGYSF